jgi:hypothetical protein
MSICNFKHNVYERRLCFEVANAGHKWRATKTLEDVNGLFPEPNRDLSKRRI